MVALEIQQPTRDIPPGRWIAETIVTAWPCTPRGLPGRAGYPVTPVSSYLTLSPITCAPEGASAGLLSDARAVSGMVTEAPDVIEARCPAVFGLSSPSSEAMIRLILRL